MQAVRLTGRFVNQNREPVEGRVKFIPSRIWLEEGDETYPAFAPEVTLRNGQFAVMLTRTDQHELPWHYTMESPMGRHTLKIEGDGPLELKKIMGKRYA